ncbi:gfo/Idh/MocA family oxidoreductase [Leptotrichia sp. OH3620_COT-345]|uniref:Gfo/Idh/MocA family protein n=1 Tax=Leptotrichia sp. OH3620_COT-345 TaxID=2491048 RepID=UPI000F64578F|nr:Gfo/Idh/MocA family oxidoreductase [Leptotrichia sp. OH3620_COT-345]RRD40342.1 gfo/Idh/MocA family oxidoreductase [Leptotrichia sp. OH3620_COT-345]
MKKKINCAVIGTRFGARTILPVIFKIKCLNIKYLCGGKDKEKTKVIANKYLIENYECSFDDIINDNELKIIFIASPHQFHYEMIKKSIKKKLIILTEKPLGINEFEVNEIIRLKNHNNNLMLVNHQLNYYPVFNKIKDKINLLGKLYYMKIYYQTNRLTYLDKSNWTLDSKKGGGLYLAMGSHILSLLSFLFSDNIKIINSYCDSFELNYAETLFEFQAFINNLRINTTCIGTSYNEDYLEIKIFGELGEVNFKSNLEATLTYLSDKKLKKENLYKGINKNISIWKLSFENYLFEIINNLNNKDYIYNDQRNTSFEKFQKQFMLLKKLEKEAKGNE